MDFLNLNILWNLIWIIPLTIVLYLTAKRKRKFVLSQLIGNKSNGNEYVNLSPSKRIIRNWLLLLSIVFMVIAIARPFWGYKILPFSGSGRDVLVVLDVSKSMLSEDIKPSRLAHAKLLLKNLMKDTPEDRYGIIAFAGSAFLECPLTVDRTSLFGILDEIDTSSIPVGGTNIEKALDTAVESFKAAEGGYKAIILITDGDELQGNSDNSIAKLKSLKIPLFAVGIGNPKKPGLIQITDKKGNKVFLRDSNGELVRSKLNEAALKKLAEATNGIYLRSTATNPGLNTIVKGVDKLIPEKYKTGKAKRPLERFQIPLFIAVMLLLIWFAMGEIKNEKK
jgi:Ca-activated chloride channel homolog